MYRPFLIAICLCAMLSASANRLLAEQSEPTSILHELRRAEENVVNGVPGSLEHRARILKSLGSSLRRTETARHGEERVQVGALIFVLSGGDPRTIRNILASMQGDDTLSSLLRGVVHITDKNYAKAQPEIEPVDPRSVPKSIAPQVALVKASLLAPKDLNLALHALDDALLLGQGTIFEQEALRQRSVILLHNGEFETFLRLYYRYRTRFSQSTYSPEFLDRLNGLLASFDYSGAPERIAKVVDLIGKFPPDQRAELQLRLSEHGLRNGNLVFVRGLAEAKLATEDEPSARRNQLALYGLSAEVVLADADESRDRLLDLETQDLPEEVSVLRQGAIMLADHFLEADTAALSQPEPEVVDGASLENPELEGQITRAKSALRTASQQFSEITK